MADPQRRVLVLAINKGVITQAFAEPKSGQGAACATLFSADLDASLVGGTESKDFLVWSTGVYYPRPQLYSAVSAPSISAAAAALIDSVGPAVALTLNVIQMWMVSPQDGDTTFGSKLFVGRSLARESMLAFDDNEDQRKYRVDAVLLVSPVFVPGLTRSLMVAERDVTPIQDTPARAALPKEFTTLVRKLASMASEKQPKKAEAIKKKLAKWLTHPAVARALASIA